MRARAKWKFAAKATALGARVPQTELFVPLAVELCTGEQVTQGYYNKLQGERKMAIERVRTYFQKFGMEDKILEFDVSSATVELAAKAVGCAPERIAKTMSFELADGCILIVAAGDARIDNGKYKQTFHTKAKMVPADKVEEKIGHSVGGVCPFGINSGVKVYLDESLKRFQTVFPACGSSNSAIELTIEELERLSGSKDWVDVCKNWQGTVTESERKGK